MAQTLPVCALLILLPCAARADDAPTPTIVRLNVTPQSAPTPALRYQLLPELREMNPGNPIQGYLICFMGQNNFFFDKTSVENRGKWQTMPLKELPLQELRGYGGAALRQADYAARLETADWQILLKLRRDGVGVLIPEVQWMRVMAEALKVRFRGEIADRRFDDALVTAKTMFALARHLGEHPTVVGDLVGLAVASWTLDPMEEMIQQPGCPNLYWALTDLPSPFIDFRVGRQGEAVWMGASFHLLDEKEPMSDAQINQFLEAIRPVLPVAIKDPGEWAAAQAKNEDRLRAARKRLIDSGFAEEKLKRFPVRQVILLDEKLESEIRRDDGLKLMAVPYWDAKKLLAAPPKENGERMFPWRPAFLKLRQRAVQLDQRIALLRCVEALRMYAAENDGKLPAKLSDVKLPLPVDPVTGKPFPYQLDGATATLRGTPPAGQENQAGYDVRYEVTIAK